MYGSDTRLPGMKYAVIARPPVTGGKLVSFDATDAMKVSGVEKVMEVQGLALALQVPAARWRRRHRTQYRRRDHGPRCAEDRVGRWRERQIRLGQLSHGTGRGRAASRAWSYGTTATPEGALKTADKVIVGEYYLPHFAHVSMETPVATANVADGKAEIWAPVQSPQGTRDDVAKTLGIAPENVTVNVTLLGGGFGRKSKCDFALEAALISKAIGAPVKVQWTREDDIRTTSSTPSRSSGSKRGWTRAAR